jgi:MFS family permease
LIATRTVLGLGVSQLVCWGITYYLIGVLGPLIVADLRWSSALVYGGFSVALLVMAASSAAVGRWLDRHGGAWAMTVGSVVIAAGCLMLGLADGVALYYAAWVVLGLAMRLTLYDAAFATLARIGGPLAKRPIAQITLLGGLASTVFWPLGGALAEHVGWRGAVFAYGLVALATIPLHATLPRGRYAARPGAVGSTTQAPVASPPPDRVRAWLYALIVALVSFLNSAMSAHMIAILAALGLAASTAVWISAARGIGQSASRLAEILFGRTLDPLRLNLMATGALPLAFVLGLAGGVSPAAAVGFSLLYGAGNGVATITRGTLPLVLFDHRVYGAVVGRLLMPSFVLSAAAPLAYAEVLERFGARGALALSIAVGAAALGASVMLALRARR